MEQAIQAFLSDLKYRQGRASNTLSAYRADLAQFSQVIATRSGRLPVVGMLTSDHVDAYVDWLDDQSYRASTVARKMAAVRSFIRFTFGSSGHRSERLLERLRSPLAEAKRNQRILTRAEVASLMSAPASKGRVRDVRDAAILALLYVTGIRAAEAVGLGTSDVDLERGVLRAAGERIERPLDMAQQPLRAYLQDARSQLLSGQDPGNLFLNQRGRPLSRQGLWLVVKRWTKVVGLRGSISPHTLRRTRAEHLLEDGQRKRDVQRYLGLTSPNTLRSMPGRVANGEEVSPDDR